MPRFENEDFDPKKRSREDINRTVPLKMKIIIIIHLWMLTLILILKKRDDVVVDNQAKTQIMGIISLMIKAMSPLRVKLLMISAEAAVIQKL